MEERLKTIIEQAKNNGTHEQLMAVVQEFKQMTTAGLPKSCILSKDQELVLRAQKEYEKMKY